MKIPLGVDLKGEIIHDFEKYPHIAMGGTTRYGKTVLLKLVIASLVAKYGERAEFGLIDLKGGLAFNRFKDLKNVLFVAGNREEVVDELIPLAGRIQHELGEYREKGYENIQEREEAEGKKFPRKFIIVDEGAELAGKDKHSKAAQEILSFIARVSGALGYRLIFCTQYPTSDCLPRQIKQNCDAKISFMIQTEYGSEVVLGEKEYDAAHLPKGVPGRAIYKTDRKREIQVYWMENEDIENIISPYRVVKEVELPATKEREDGSDTPLLR